MTQRTVVIGGTSGIGLATAGLLLERGHEVVIAGRSPERLERALKHLDGHGERVSGRPLDASDEAGLKEFFAAVGPFDHLVNTATLNGGVTSLAELEPAELIRHLEGKLLAHLLSVRASLGTLRTDGSITLVSAINSQLGAPGLVLLAPSNAATEAAARVLAAELAPRRVNVVSPGVIDTPWWDWVPDEARQETLRQAAGALLQRPGRPEEVAHAIMFLVENGYTTGVVLPVDGGARLQQAR